MRKDSSLHERLRDVADEIEKRQNRRENVPDDAVFLTDEECSILKQAIHNYKQEIDHGIIAGEKLSAEGPGVVSGKFIASGHLDIMALPAQYMADSRGTADYQELAEKLQATAEISGNEFYSCSCGNVTLWTDPIADDPELCPECNAEIPVHPEYRGETDA
jgi:hypothetical protein